MKNEDVLEELKLLSAKIDAGFRKIAEARRAAGVAPGERLLGIRSAAPPWDFETTIYDTVSLGDLIDALSKLKAGAEVRFDFGYLAPAKVASYRGHYAHLALGYAAENTITVADLLNELRGAVGKTFEGWKGGSYRMDVGTPLWVDNRGDSSGTAIVGMRERYDDMFILVTKQVG